VELQGLLCAALIVRFVLSDNTKGKGILNWHTGDDFARFFKYGFVI